VGIHVCKEPAVSGDAEHSGGDLRDFATGSSTTGVAKQKGYKQRIGNESDEN